VHGASTRKTRSRSEAPGAPRPWLERQHPRFEPSRQCNCLARTGFSPETSRIVVAATYFMLMKRRAASLILAAILMSASVILLPTSCVQKENETIFQELWNSG
jgi:hypothetical protein